MELFTKLSDRTSEQISGGAGNNVPRGIADFDNSKRFLNKGVLQSNVNAGIGYSAYKYDDGNGDEVSGFKRTLPNGKTLLWGDASIFF